ncbi:hypothetical protein [Halostreptopolyspora alba]|uniref:DUF2637 domain-containing protein n=1 Tax=Halostreptopolyspora alba TaxID=2487137 RepID=A0A3N0EA86_9ACTN|nr:hypothetical protein EFW17_10695 [Nocardiopsaceae bacterium YIM 96095]
MTDSSISADPDGPRRAVRLVALAILSCLTATGFAVSYSRLHGFMASYGETGWTAYASAGMVDSLALAGLLVALVFRDWWARAAFVLALGFTGFANGLVGWQFAGAFGLVVGLVPIVSMELAYRIALTLLLPPRAPAPDAGADQAEPGPDHPVAATPDQLDQAPPDQLDQVALPLVEPGPAPDHYVTKADRLDQVRALLADDPHLTAQQLADQLGVSLTSGRRYARQVKAESVTTPG